jgi:hypothetical protein
MSKVWAQILWAFAAYFFERRKIAYCPVRVRR